jgi:hypothetical protein
MSETLTLTIKSTKLFSETAFRFSRLSKLTPKGRPLPPLRGLHAQRMWEWLGDVTTVCREK